VPFTLAHPAAILPLRGLRHLHTLPLILGAMSPDLPYYLPGLVARNIPDTHEFQASFTTCLALAYLLMIALFVLRRPLTALLAPRARWLCLHSLAPLRERRAWLLAIPAIILGTWTHLLWDAFTHSDGWIVHRVAALSAPVTIGSYTGPMCHVLQYVSSVFGLAVLAIWYTRLRAPARVHPDPHAPRSAVGPILLLAASAAVLIGGVQATVFLERTHEIYRSINILLTHSLAWFAAMYLVAGIIITLEHHTDSRF
jgi:hypothetical protein